MSYRVIISPPPKKKILNYSPPMRSELTDLKTLIVNWPYVLYKQGDHMNTIMKADIFQHLEILPKP